MDFAPTSASTRHVARPLKHHILRETLSLYEFIFIVKMEEREGFEPSHRKTQPNALAKRPLKPLGYRSVYNPFWHSAVINSVSFFCRYKTLKYYVSSSCPLPEVRSLAELKATQNLPFYLTNYSLKRTRKNRLFF